MNNNNEMLDPQVFTRPRSWQAKVRIKYLLTDEDDLTAEEINGKGKLIAIALNRCKLFRIKDIISRFEEVDDLDEFNDILDDMYTYCDTVRIWVE